VIKIQLCPQEYLENKYWYVADIVAAALVVFAMGYFGDEYLAAIQSRIDEVSEQSSKQEEELKQLNPKVERFKNLDKDIAALTTKLRAIEAITKSKIARYRVLIVLEHLQNLKPDGVWFESLNVDEAGPIIMAARALDNILIAEFMASLSSTVSQEVDSADLRTLVYFPKVRLMQANTAMSTDQMYISDDLVSNFSFEMEYKERQAPTPPPDKIAGRFETSPDLLQIHDPKLPVKKG